MGSAERGNVQPRTKPSGEWGTWGGKRALGDRMAGGEEMEGDGVACYSARYVIRGVFKPVLSHIDAKIDGFRESE